MTQPNREPKSADSDLCSDCPPVGYPTDETRCNPCPRRSAETEHVEPEGEVSRPTEDDVRAFQAKFDAENDAEFTANPPEGSAGFTRSQWSSLTFGDQAHYRRGNRNPDYRPDDPALRAMASVISDTPSPSIISGYGVWAFDILELLHRRGWKLVHN